MDGEEEEDEDAFEDRLDLGSLGRSRDELTPNVMMVMTSSQYSLNRTPLIQQGFQSQNSLNRSQDYSNDCFARPMKPTSPLKKRPVPTPRFGICYEDQKLFEQLNYSLGLWGGRLNKRFCLHFSESSPCSAWAVCCSSAQLPVELSENI